MNDELVLKAKGCLLGLAVGDALGTTLEFTPKDSGEKVTDIVGGGPFSLNVGDWTDDTSMALCLGESLLECLGFDPIDQLKRYLRWRDNGHWSSKGYCFDIGVTTGQALQNFLYTGNPYPGLDDERSAGNGSLMRLAPIALFYSRNATDYISFMGGKSSLTTHAEKRAVQACEFYAPLLVNAMTADSDNKEALLDPQRYNFLFIKEWLPEVKTVIDGSYRVKTRDEIRGSGYVVSSLEAALWAFWNSDNFRDGALLAVNLGEDADTTGAIYGQLAGAFYGIDGIPFEWKRKIKWGDRIVGMAEDLILARGGCCD